MSESVKLSVFKRCQIEIVLYSIIQWKYFEFSLAEISVVREFSIKKAEKNHMNRTEPLRMGR